MFRPPPSLLTSTWMVKRSPAGTEPQRRRACKWVRYRKIPGPRSSRRSPRSSRRSCAFVGHEPRLPPFRRLQLFALPARALHVTSASSGKWHFGHPSLSSSLSASIAAINDCVGMRPLATSCPPDSGTDEAKGAASCSSTRALPPRCPGRARHRSIPRPPRRAASPAGLRARAFPTSLSSTSFNSATSTDPSMPFCSSSRSSTRTRPRSTSESSSAAIRPEKSALSAGNSTTR